MRKIGGIYAGAGTSALYIGLGFMPDEVKLFNIDQAEAEILTWNRLKQRSTVGYEGEVRTAIAGDSTMLTAGNGVIPYVGGDAIATASANYIIPANAVSDYQGDMRQKGTAGTVNAWSLDTSGNRTGSFNVAANTTYVGVGSPIWIKPVHSEVHQKYVILAISQNGDGDDEVTLNAAAPSGEITFIGYKLDFVNAPAGTDMPAGLKVNDTTYVNVSGQEFGISAEQWD